MSQELELYLERKALCMIDGGLAEDQAVEIAYEQIRPMLTNWMPDVIFKDLKRFQKK